ncbi:hypothetical protein ABQF34_27760 [Mycolicibacterium boenickei]
MSAAPAGSSGGLTRSEIEDWPTRHLEDAAPWWREKAAESDQLFARHRQNIAAPGGTEWTGDAKDAALDRVAADQRVVEWQGEVQRNGATIAENGTLDILAAKSDALVAIVEAEADGFTVGEDLTVRDARRVDVFTMAARHTAAAEHAEDIRWAAERLVQTDTAIGQRLQEKAAELDGIRFKGEGDGGTVQAANFKQSPIPVPGTDETPARPREPNPIHPGRDASGRFMPGNTGSADGAAAAEARLKQEESDTGRTFNRQQIRVAIIDPNTGQPMTDPKTGKPLFRFYDALQPTGQPGRYVGIEVKSGESQLTRNQRIFDDRVNSGKPATGVLNGQPVEIVAARELRAPMYLPPADGARSGEAPSGRGAAAAGAGPGPGAGSSLPPVESGPRGGGFAVGGVPADVLPLPVDGPGHEAGEPDLPVLGDQYPDPSYTG